MQVDKNKSGALDKVEIEVLVKKAKKKLKLIDPPYMPRHRKHIIIWHLCMQSPKRYEKAAFVPYCLGFYM